jgi:hypothetical protein
MMKSLGLQARGKRRFKATTNSAHDLPIAPNLLARNFTVDAPNKVWTGDITCIWTDEGWLYLAAEIDLFGRQVVGFARGECMTRTLVMDALQMAWFRRHPQARPDLPLGSRQSIRQQRLPPAPAGQQNGKLDEPQGRLLGQCGHRNAVRITEGRTAPRHALRRAAPSQGRGHGLDLPFKTIDDVIRRWAMPVPWRSNKNGVPATSAWPHNHCVKEDPARGKG